MGSITIRSAGGALKATLPRVLQAASHASLSGEMTFACRVPIAAAPSVTPGDVLSYGGEDYDVVRVAKRTASPQPLAEISGEHVSYRLNEAPLEAGTYYDTPAAVLAQLLTGTGFSVGTVQVSDIVLLSLTSPTNVRAAVMELAAAAEAEILFRGYSISLMTHIGSTTPVELSDRKNVEAVSATLDNRSDSQTYDLTLYKETALELGDAVSIEYSSLGLTASARVISIDRDPFNFRSVKIVTGAPVPSYVDSAIRAINGKVGLDQPYYGVTISREYGMKIARSDGMSEALFNSDVFAMRALIDGVMKDRIYFDPIRGDYVFDGALGADAIFTESLYAEQGDIAELTVDRLSTSRRIRKYILQDISDDNFIKVQDQYIRWITGTVVPTTGLITEDDDPLLTETGLQLMEEAGSAAVEQARNRMGQGLFWQREPVSHTNDGYPLDANGKQVYATTAESNWPVMVYKYTELVKSEYAFEELNGVYVPKVILGAGDELGYSRGYIYKDVNSFKLRYTSSAAKNVDITFSDEGFVDAMHRRLSYIDIETATGMIYYGLEGSDNIYYLIFRQGENSATFSWPDGFQCEVNVL